MSASTQITVPIFDGSDDADAEDFIHSVRTKAFAEGKDTDHSWILRLVATCLTGDALRWHAYLKPEVQNDWGLLQKALLERFCPLFKGVDGAECERFICSLRRRIFEEDRVADNEWITNFVASCMAEDALRWHSDLAPEIQEDWKLLQKAMLSRYPPPDIREHRVKSRMIPMPASAISVPSGVKTGVLRFVDPANPGAQNYLSCKLPTSGYINFTQVRSEALSIDYDSYGAPGLMTIKNLDGGYDSLGIHWYHPAVQVLTSSSVHLARFVGLSGQNSTIKTDKYPAKGTTHANVWSVRPDGNVDVVWTDSNGVKVTLFPKFSASELILTGEGSAHDSSWKRGSLIFETN